MSERKAFYRILALLHEAALDPEQWSRATALIDDGLRTHGSSTVFGDGTSDENIRIYFAWCFFHGQRHRELERDYFENHHAFDERVPRLRLLPDARLFHNTELYTGEELKTSAAYNELLTRHHLANAINVRLDGPTGTRIVWVVNDPADGDRWSSTQLESIRYLLPHIRETVHVQQALAGAGALGASLAKRLDTTGLGIVQLDGDTLRALLLLLYGAGLRFGEAQRLTLHDVDLHDAVLTIRDTKFHKTRLVPVGAQLANALRDYALKRSQRPLPMGMDSTFVANLNGTPLWKSTVRIAFAKLLQVAGIRHDNNDGRQSPCFHSLRHTAAVHRLIAWYRQGADVQRLLPALSTWLGHAHLDGTQVYLSMTPELLHEASLRFDGYINGEDHE